MNKRGEFEFEIEADFGDLVEVDGYPNRVFRVEGYQLITNCYPDEEYTEIVYDLVDAISGEWLEADADDLTLLADAGQADEYLKTIDLRNYPRPQAFMFFGIDFGNEMEAVSMAEKERPLTPREKSAKEAEERKQMRKLKAEIIDDLLDQYNDVKALYEAFGDEEYNDKAFAIKAELYKLTCEDSE
jgi:hypothetical protein